ncbi:hypothetical protein ACFYRN_45510 [Streptomyces sp. NPDC005227]|uniref:hypothetical protein n=1 Tax=Streptomyces sp. NPDC005227 TaxID=3364707 RepID=UPI0036AD81CB
MSNGFPTGEFYLVNQGTGLCLFHEYAGIEYGAQAATDKWTGASGIIPYGHTRDPLAGACTPLGQQQERWKADGSWLSNMKEDGRGRWCLHAEWEKVNDEKRKSRMTELNAYGYYAVAMARSEDIPPSFLSKMKRPELAKELRAKMRQALGVSDDVQLHSEEADAALYQAAAESDLWNVTPSVVRMEATGRSPGPCGWHSVGGYISPRGSELVPPQATFALSMTACRCWSSAWRFRQMM